MNFVNIFLIGKMMAQEKESKWFLIFSKRDLKYWFSNYSLRKKTKKDQKVVTLQEEVVSIVQATQKTFNFKLKIWTKVSAQDKIQYQNLKDKLKISQETALVFNIVKTIL